MAEKKREPVINWDNVYNLFFPAMLITVLGGAFLAAGTLLYQCFGWLKTGYWEAITTRDGLLAIGIDVPDSTYVGFQNLVDWALGVPLFLGAFLYPVIVFGAVLALLEHWSENPK